MKLLLITPKVINIIALFFLLLGPYGLAITGGLQVTAALLFFIAFPKNKLIYIYFGLVIVFFIFWQGIFDWLFAIPIFLLFFFNLYYSLSKK